MITVMNEKWSRVGALALLGVMSTAVVLAYPPDNAAVLYYRACLYYQAEPTMMDVVGDFVKGEAPSSEAIEKYLHKNRRAVGFALDGTEVENCDWGVNYSRGNATLMPHYSPLKDIARLILADARILAAQGDYELALERYLSVRRMARHVKQGLIISYLVGTAMDGLANRCVQTILADMPPDLGVLKDFKSRLAAVEHRPDSLEAAISLDAETVMLDMRPEKGHVILELVLPADERMASSVRELVTQLISNGDEQFFERNRDYWLRLTDEAITSLGLPYEQAYADLSALSEKPARDANVDPHTTLASIFMPALHRVYGLGIRAQTHCNAVKTAVEIYIINAETGHFPETLPLGLPKDLFSGEDFEYERKADGFVLRCRGKNLDRNEIHEYEFKAKK